MTTRRSFLAALSGLASLPLLLLLGDDAEAGPGARAARRRVRRRVRRRIRRRIRRRAAWRVAGARRLLVVPLALAVGWELAVDDRVVVVHEVKNPSPDVTVVVVRDGSGKTEEIEVVREDNADNAVELDGTELAEGDTSTPGREVEVEVEVEVEE